MNFQFNRVIVTGAAGFIGFHLTRLLLEKGYNIWGIDNINQYYDINLKYSRLEETGIRKEKIEDGKEVHSRKYPHYRFIKLDLTDQTNLFELFRTNKLIIKMYIKSKTYSGYGIVEHDIRL